MSEPEVALVFTPDRWVEELHRHLSDHGGARVRQVVVEPEVALEEEYDVLVAGHRWPALTRAFVADVHARGRAVLGVYDREERSARALLLAAGVDDVIEADRGPRVFVDAIRALRARRESLVVPETPSFPLVRNRRTVVIGGAPGAGRTEVAVHLAPVFSGVLVDADDVAPSIAARLGLAVEPNLRNAIDAVEHGNGALDDAVVVTPVVPGVRVLAGLPSAAAWVHIRPGEVVRVIERLAEDTFHVTVDGLGAVDEIGAAPRNRFGTARALAVEADVIVGVCSATPVGLTRFLSWVVDVRTLAPEAKIVVAMNRAPAARFRRGELYDELARSLPTTPIVFLGDDARVADAMWEGRLARRGPFVRGIEALAEAVTDVLGARRELGQTA